MTLTEHDTMYKITNDLDFQDHEQMLDYASDCDMLCAHRTASYIRWALSGNMDLSVIRDYLDMDFTS